MGKITTFLFVTQQCLHVGFGMHSGLCFSILLGTNGAGWSQVVVEAVAEVEGRVLSSGIVRTRRLQWRQSLSRLLHKRCVESKLDVDRAWLSH